MSRFFAVSVVLVFLFVCFPVQSANPQEMRGTSIAQKRDSGDGTVNGTYWALIIGIDKYKNLPPDMQLASARADASALAALLKEKYGFAEERVQELYDEKATRKNILNALRQFTKTLAENDNLVIYYAGHGEYDKETKMGDWVPTDAELGENSSYVSNSDIREYIKSSKAKHILTIADSCFGESLMGVKTRSLGNVSPAAIAELYKDRSRWIITSGGLYPVPDQGKENHSTFAYYLLKILERNQSGYTPVGHILTELQDKVSTDSKQLPRGAPISGIGDEGGQFIFRLANIVPPPEENVVPTQDNRKFEEERLRMEEEKQRMAQEKERMAQEKLLMEKKSKEQAEKLALEKGEMEQRSREQEQRAREQAQKLAKERRELEEKSKDTGGKGVFLPPTF